eukprot:SAG31_NODE_3096_length_4680_cov_1.703995_2_plen_79_part_00
MRNVVYVDLAGTWSQYKGGPLLMTEACSKQFHVPPNASCGDRPLENFAPAVIDYNVCEFFGFASVSLLEEHHAFAFRT